ncbi:uncharacterized protein LOC117793311 [Drosophila innubila]|uniref:uncharacterized protein LOC117793311 n=1 Tax=Drosophila innubila TaxID=198719 RepID=UPI00148CA83B|nr:uncharacterized protein LOC117793311 [Drosophila innubila]
MEEMAREECCRSVCPLANCQVRLDHSQLLVHLISEHLVETPGVSFGLRMRQVESGERTLLPLAPQQLIVGQDHCLCLLNWAGNGSRNLAMPQCRLPLSYRSLTGHLPVLVMVRRIPWPALPSSSTLHEDNKMRYLYVLWLAAPATRRPVTARLGFLNRELHCSLRVRRQLRNFDSPMEFNKYLLGADRNYLTLSERQLQQMCCQNDSGCFLEVVILGVPN